MKLPLVRTTLVLLTLNLAAFADHPIPADSKHDWDYRGEPKGITNAEYEKLFSCKTYEELRDALINAIRDLESSSDCSAPLYYASDCRLALIRTYYMLGETGRADKLLQQYSSVHRDAKGRLDLSKVPLEPVPITKGGESEPSGARPAGE